MLENITGRDGAPGLWSTGQIRSMPTVPKDSQKLFDLKVNGTWGSEGGSA